MSVGGTQGRLGAEAYMNLDPSAFHVLEFEEKRLLFDSNSMYLFEIDETMEDIIRNFDSLTIVRRKYGKRRFVESIEKLNGIWKISRLHSMYNDAFKRTRARRISSLWLNISHRCNLRCIYCYAEGGNYGKKEELMDRNTAEQAVDFLMKMREPGSNCRLVFFGGEPLLNFPVMEACILYAEKRAREKNVSITFHLVTNGTLLNRRIAHFIKRHGVTVQISLDGPPGLNNKLRPYRDGRGSYNTIHSNLQMLREEGIDKIAARATVTHHNCELAMMLRFFHEVGFTRVRMPPVMADPAHDCSLTLEDIDTIKKQYGKIAREIIESIRNCEETDLDCFSPYIYQLETGRKKRHFCGSGFKFLAVTPKGELYLCHRLISRDYLEIGTLWDGIDIPKSLEKWGVPSVGEKEPCCKCWARYYCGGGCAASALEKYGDPNKPEETFCEIVKGIVENALRIYCYMNTLPQESVTIQVR